LNALHFSLVAIGSDGRTKVTEGPFHISLVLLANCLLLPTEGTPVDAAAVRLARRRAVSHASSRRALRVLLGRNWGSKRH